MRFTETQNRLGGKGSLIQSSPAINPALLNQVSKCHIHVYFEHYQGGELQPIPMPDHPFSEEMASKIQSKPPPSCKLLSGSCREQHKRKTAYLYLHLYIIVATFGI